MNPSKHIWWCLGLALMIIAVYLQTLSFGYISYDDAPNIFRNPRIIAGLRSTSVVWFLTNLFDGNWIPLNWISHMAVFHFLGSNPGVHHLVNIGLHLLNTFLLLLFLKRLTGKFWLSFYVAAFFALHPLHVESVAWISQRKDVLSTFFWLLACLRYLDYVQTKQPLHFIGALLAFGLGLMVKPALVTFPVIFILIDWWPLGRAKLEKSKLKIYLEKIPFFFLSGLSGLLTVLAHRQNDWLNSAQTISLDLRLANAALSLMKYLRKTIWPFDLAVFYPYESVANIYIKGSLAAVAVAAITLWTVRKAKEHPYLLFGWLWYLSTLLPVLQIVSFAGFSMADRYTYVPLIGIFFMLTWGVRYLILEWKNTQVLFRVGGFSLIFLVAALSWSQVRNWKSTVTIFEHAARVAPNNFTAHENLANHYTVNGNYEKALKHYEVASNILPYAKTLNNLANTYFILGHLDRALSTYQLAIAQDPEESLSWANLGLIYIRKEMFEDAVNSFGEAIRLNPESLDPYFGMIEALVGQGRFVEAGALVKRKGEEFPEHPGFKYWKKEIEKEKNKP